MAFGRFGGFAGEAGNVLKIGDLDVARGAPDAKGPKAQSFSGRSGTAQVVPSPEDAVRVRCGTGLLVFLCLIERTLRKADQEVRPTQPGVQPDISARLRPRCLAA
jgi:hypothetical protein